LLIPLVEWTLEDGRGTVELKHEDLKTCYATEGVAPKKFEAKEGNFSITKGDSCS
jgi:hypothetical protein